MWNEEREDRYISGWLDGKRDRAAYSARYDSANSDNADYVEGYDDGYEGLRPKMEYASR